MAADFAPQRANTGIAVGAIADQREPIGHRRRPHAEFLDDTALVERLAPHAIEAHDALALHALREILVGRAHDDAFDGARSGEARRGRRERVVALELHHWPSHDPERAARVLGQTELFVQKRIHALPGLVAGIQIVAKRLDDVIERDGNVRDLTLAEQCEHRARQPAGGADFLAALVDARGTAVVSPEELECAVDEMHVHACVPLVQCAACSLRRAPVLV